MVGSGPQVVSGAFRVVQGDDERLMLERQPNDIAARVGNIRRVEFVRASVADAIEPYERGDLDIVDGPVHAEARRSGADRRATTPSWGRLRGPGTSRSTTPTP